MSELGELVAAMVDFDKKEKCDFKPDEHKWKCNLEGKSETLANYLGNKPDANSESELSSTEWPSQAHHLIPHLTLKAHAIEVWLKMDRRIYQDTKYNVDHKNNGMWMPYASKLPEWASGSEPQKQKLMFKIMGLANIQMHQGKHSSTNTYGIAIRPYKARVIDYLDKINNHAISHYAGPGACQDCKNNKFDKKYPPTENTVRYVDKTSVLLKKDITACRIFVSRIAAEFALAGGFK